MWSTIIVIIIGILGGMAVGFQSPIAGQMGGKVGGAAGSFIVHLGGLIFSSILLYMRGGENIRDWKTVPWYMLISGIFGLILYLTINETLPKLGATTSISLIIIGQLIMGLLIDQFGWFGVAQRPIDFVKGLGVVLLMSGGYLMIK